MIDRDAVEEVLKRYHTPGRRYLNSIVFDGKHYLSSLHVQLRGQSTEGPTSLIRETCAPLSLQMLAPAAGWMLPCPVLPAQPELIPCHAGLQSPCSEGKVMYIDLLQGCRAMQCSQRRLYNTDLPASMGHTAL